ncbi:MULTISPECIES: glucuronate isomerase [unclassified Oceanispirochaeta]|uniref:glucuronate isomerase n=1 Tax=unclassified Oceanispirochaeta TaxID=2635722 RepID=UPI000E09AB17|nr:MULTISPECIES: glucuronate isomerase [unclassified Oceanispirochaeta]MBF9014297.1 glucuronate isomerase [Oceanispirochaeta sp. M2]NPD71183.1 glucuronate isomerase [Oceanispirochaeta sp. M1]RDG33573.1 glucuronate isomerase [Oceanispirochaeta sp. M1]
MKFINDNFILENKTAAKLYHEYAEGLPIIDYHCHLDPKEIAQDIKWENLAQVWLGGDHYKWRCMRSNGVDESYITGDAPDREKFQKFAETMPYLLRNPMYHWCHLELARYFGIDDILLNGDTAQEVWDRSLLVIKNGMSARQLMIDSNVKAVCTTDDPVDTLEYHKALAEEGFQVKVLPTWRPDKILAIDKPFWKDYIISLSKAASIDIRDYASLVKAMKIRHQYFHDTGCRLSDHGLERCYALDYKEDDIQIIFSKALFGESISEFEVDQFRTSMMMLFGRMDAEKGWTKQIHLGALRSNNSRMFESIGPDTGFDSIDDKNIAGDLSRYLDKLDSEKKLPKTILYNLNPRDNELIASMLGNFQDGSVPGKIQMGSGWWFLDQKDGMERQMEALSQLGLLRRFVGMLTDSRSFLSYARHEYFRRILCNILGKDMEKGLIPMDLELVGSMVKEISYENAREYFGFDL